MTTTDWLTLMDSAGGGFEPVPDGDYDVIVKEVETKKTGKGKDMIVAKLQITAGPHANRLVWNNFTVSPESPGAMGYFFQHMGLFGMDRNFFAANPGIEQVAQNMLNKPCRISVTTRAYQGQPRNDVKKITAAMGTPGVMPAGAVPQPGVPALTVPTAAPPMAPPLAAPPAAPVSAPVAAPQAPPVAAAPVAAPPVAPAPPAPAMAPPAAPPAPAPVAAPAPAAAPPQIFQQPDGTLVLADGTPCDQFGNPVAAPVAAAPVPVTTF